MLLVPGEEVQGYHKYRIERTVGSGAYACVYAATDELGRKVALKEYYPAANSREAGALKSLFERERYVMTQASPHPLIPTFYEGFVSETYYYLAQEFIEGQGLDEIVAKNKKLSREWMLKWAISLCEALSYLHERQIIHHDLKPANIRITPQNHLKLLDYGAAVYFGKPNASVPEAMLKENELFGTEGYLPPEVEETFTADIRTDIFALGCILYEMVMGEAPEQQRLNERNLYVTTPLMQRKDVDLPFVKLVATALSYNTEFRYASAKHFLEELKKITPPLLLVSHKSVFYGKVARGTNPTQKFRIYNGGGRGDLIGDIKPLVPWIKCEVPHFKTQKRDVILIADPSRVPKKNEMVRGQVQIITQDVLDAEGKPASRADRWTVDCYITVVAKPTDLHFVDAAEGAPVPAYVRARATSTLPLTLANRGEVAGDVVLQVTGAPPGVTVSPEKVTVPGESSVVVTVTIKAGVEMPAGSQHLFWIEAASAGTPPAKAALSLQAQAPFDYLIGWISRSIRKATGGLPAGTKLESATGQRLLPPPKS